jgi:hypothetical protein
MKSSQSADPATRYATYLLKEAATLSFHRVIVFLLDITFLAVIAPFAVAASAATRNASGPVGKATIEEIAKVYSKVVENSKISELYSDVF